MLSSSVSDTILLVLLKDILCSATCYAFVTSLGIHFLQTLSTMKVHCAKFLKDGSFHFQEYQYSHSVQKVLFYYSNNLLACKVASIVFWNLYVLVTILTEESFLHNRICEREGLERLYLHDIDNALLFSQEETQIFLKRTFLRLNLLEPSYNLTSVSVLLHSTNMVEVILHSPFLHFTIRAELFFKKLNLTFTHRTKKIFHKQDYKLQNHEIIFNSV